MTVRRATAESFLRDLQRVREEHENHSYGDRRRSFGHDGGAYNGLPTDSNIIVVTALFPFRELLGHDTFSGVLYIAVITLAILNVAPFRMPKLVGGWYYLVAIYVLGMTALNLSSLTR